MKILHINSCNYGSTGNIMINISNKSKENNQISFTSCPNGRSMRKKKLDNHIYIGNILERNISLKLEKITGYNGCLNIFATKMFLKKLNKLKPDILHLHNLHNGYINLPLLFKYIKKNNIRTVWTLHDCWSFTGQCPHFAMVKCDKWKTGCNNCNQYKQYPFSLVDNTKQMWKLKKKWFNGIEKLTIITPSQWLANLVKQSYLKDYPVKVINSGIDLEVFIPIQNNFREKHNISKEKFVLLGVAFGWGEKKGLDVFVELSKRLDDRYQIVLVGTNENVDKQLPNNIISIHRTNNQAELAEIYSAANLFVNPTREEVLGLVNIEANACGVPVITFDAGGSPECIDSSSGLTVACDDIDEMEKEIIRICENHVFDKEDCIKRAKSFDMNDRFNEYIDLYKSF